MVHTVSTGPRFRRRVDANHAELRKVIKDCAKAFPLMEIAWMDTSNLGGKVGDGIIQFMKEKPDRIGRTNFLSWYLETHLLEFKSSKKKKFTKSQELNPLKLIWIDCRADIFSLLNQKDWELI